MQRIVNERVIVQFALLVCAGALYLSTFNQNFSAADVAQSPMFFPRITLILWMGLNVIALAQTIWRQEKSSDIASFIRIAIVVVAALIYTNMIGPEGFFLPSVVFALICLPVFGIRNPFLIVAFAVLVPAALLLLFNHTLGMPLPTSRFTYFF